MSQNQDMVNMSDEINIPNTNVWKDVWEDFYDNNDNTVIDAVPTQVDNIFIDINNGFVLKLTDRLTIITIGISDNKKYETMRKMTVVEKEKAERLGLLF